MEAVPTVDLTDLDATSRAALDAACRDHGFFLLAGHGLDRLIDETWSHTRCFFESEPALRDSVRRSADSPLGYYDRELTKRLRDHKEVFDFIDPLAEREAEMNRWPDLVGFRPALVRFFDAFAELANQAVDLVCTTAGLSAAVESGYRTDRTSSSVRLNHYTVDDPVPPSQREGLRPLGEVALGHHTDPGVITLLLQDEIGGLQARSGTGDWIDVPPRPGTIVVNLGDVMQVWTNDRYRAAIHRVQPMGVADRYSIPYFGNPEAMSTVQPIEALTDGTARYRPFVWAELMKGRIDDNYADLGADDSQVSDYAI